MKVVFVSREHDAVRLISRGIKKSRDEHLFFSSVRELLKNFYLCRHDTDMFIFDYSQFHVCKILFFGQLRTNERKIPLIFYNDPFSHGPHRVLYWVYRNERFFGMNAFHHLIPFFSSLNACLEQHKIQPASPAWRKDKTRGCDGNEPTEAAGQKTAEKKIDMPPALSKIFSYFKQNCGREISLAELLRLDDDFASENTVYSYISRLRKIIRHENQFKIMRTGKSRYKLCELGV